MGIDCYTLTIDIFIGPKIITFDSPGYKIYNPQNIILLLDLKNMEQPYGITCPWELNDPSPFFPQKLGYFFLHDSSPTSGWTWEISPSPILLTPVYSHEFLRTGTFLELAKLIYNCEVDASTEISPFWARYITSILTYCWTYIWLLYIPPILSQKFEAFQHPLVDQMNCVWVHS